MVETPQISVTKSENEVTVTGGGMLDLTNSQEFQVGLKAASETAESVIVDLKPAVFIDTAIVQYIANAAVTLLKRNKRLKVLVGEGSYPQQVIKTVGFDQLMDVTAE